MNVHGLRATGLRAGLIAVSLLLPLAVGTAAAHAACSEPELEVSKTNAKAGETVSFSLSGTTPGAEYLLKVGESELNAGTASGTTVSDSFKMPELGAKGHPANVQAVLAHDQCENSPWKLVQQVAYLAPAAKKPAQKKTTGTSPGAKEIANLKAQRAKERRAALKREKALQKALKKRQAAAKRRTRAQKQKVKENQKRQRLAQARKKKGFEEALRRRQREQEARRARTKKPKSSGKDPTPAPSGEGDSSKAFVALGLLYALIGGLGGGGFLLWRRSGRGVPMSKSEADAATPPVPEFGETTGASPMRPGLAVGEEELDAEHPSPAPEKLAAASPTPEKLAAAGPTPEKLDGKEASPASDKEKLEAELRRVLTDAGIDAELEGIVADAQAEAERRGVPMNADLMMQLLCDEVDNSAKLSEPAEGELRSKLQEIVAEEKERVAIRHPDA